MAFVPAAFHGSRHFGWREHANLAFAGKRSAVDVGGIPRLAPFRMARACELSLRWQTLG
jgi:hypothetical protein